MSKKRGFVSDAQRKAVMAILKTTRWYHSGDLKKGLSVLDPFHVGTKRAALSRAASLPDDTRRLYKIIIDPRSKVLLKRGGPFSEFDARDEVRLDPYLNLSGDFHGFPNRKALLRLRKRTDIVPYLNAFEDRGKLSLGVINPKRVIRIKEVGQLPRGALVGLGPLIGEPLSNKKKFRVKKKR